MADDLLGPINIVDEPEAGDVGEENLSPRYRAFREAWGSSTACGLLATGREMFYIAWEQGIDARLAAAHKLLNLIHGDTGQHTAEVGFGQSCEDAAAVYEHLRKVVRDG